MNCKKCKLPVRNSDGWVLVNGYDPYHYTCFVSKINEKKYANTFAESLVETVNVMKRREQ